MYIYTRVLSYILVSLFRLVKVMIGHQDEMQPADYSTPFLVKERPQTRPHEFKKLFSRERESEEAQLSTVERLLGHVWDKLTIFSTINGW